MTPPTVVLEGPTGPVRATVPVRVRIEPAGRAVPVEVRVNDRALPVPDGEQLVVDTTALPDGQQQLVMVAEDRSWRKNRTTASVSLQTDNTPPALTVDSQPRQVLQGHTWLVRIRTNEPASVDAHLGEHELPIQVGNGFGWSIVGFSPTADTTTVPVRIDGRDQAGNETHVSEPVQVAAEQFPRENVDVPASLAELLGGEVRAEEDRRLAEYYKPVSPEKLWEGRFLIPVAGPIITEFATIRSFNGGPVVGPHQGADIGAPTGRPVVAPARGRVYKVEQVRLRGNMVILDHGLGVYTTYAHLSAVDVKVGDMVQRGQAFGKVGSTGLSTGPHLHWELWVGGANVNPLEWTERDIP
ncbi:MAG: M23 family metallopeptidase [Chloroflexi bacterium]|nr:M23 family metallopeptidase [Chloroflexota bacterium]